MICGADLLERGFLTPSQAALSPDRKWINGDAWSDPFGRPVMLDFDEQRFRYLACRTTEDDPPAAFTPGVSYPLALLLTETLESRWPQDRPAEIVAEPPPPPAPKKRKRTKQGAPPGFEQALLF